MNDNNSTSLFPNNHFFEKFSRERSWEPGWIGVVRGVRARELFQSISYFNDVTRISLASLTHATKK